MSDLKPCPFCPDGGRVTGWLEPIMNRDPNNPIGRVTCQSCGAHVKWGSWQGRPLHAPGSPQNPHRPGTKENPTVVYKGEWFKRLCDEGDWIIVLLESSPTGTILGIPLEGGLQNFSNYLEGFTFINSLRP